MPEETRRRRRRVADRKESETFVTSYSDTFRPADLIPVDLPEEGEDVGDGVPNEALERMYDNYVDSILRQLLQDAEISIKKWRATLWSLSTVVVDNISPDCNEDTNLRSLVKVKRVWSGKVDECNVYPGGAIFTGGVVVTGMATKLRNAKVLLIKGSISYYRSNDKYVSLAKNSKLEDEYGER